MLESLNELPQGVADAEALIGDLDQCFMLGFSRLGQDQLDTLASLARAFTGTPLAERLDAAVDAFSRAQYMPEHFLTLAAARQSLHGAIYDALAAQAAAATGRPRREVAMAAPPETPSHVATWMDSSRQWLVEVALGGLLQLEMETVAPFMATLEQLQDTPEAGRIAMVLTGWINELLDAMPIAGMSEVPTRRWVDLWTRCMISAIALPPLAESSIVSGTFHPLGADMRHHPNAVSVVAYGVLEHDGGAELVRTYASSYKVDVVTGDELWRALEPRYDALFQGLAGNKAVKVTDMRLHANGDMIWTGGGSITKAAADPFALGVAHLMADGLASPEAAPGDRHPVQLAFPVFLDGYKVAGSAGAEEVEVDGLHAHVDEALVSNASDTHGVKLAGSKQLIALLRYDGGWSLQPLAVGDGKKLKAFAGGNALAAKTSPTISKLQERASRLLRAKA